MTTTVKIHVNGAYRARVDITYKDGSTEMHTIDAAGERQGKEQSFSLRHPADATFHIVEEETSMPREYQPGDFKALADDPDEDAELPDLSHDSGEFPDNPTEG